MTARSKTDAVNKIYTITDIVVIAVIVFAFVLIFTTDRPADRAVDVTEMTLGWTNSADTYVDITNIPSGHSVYKQQIDASQINGRELCFRSKNVNLYIYQDGKLIYSYAPPLFRLFGKSYGLMYHCVDLKMSDRPVSEILIEAENVYTDSRAYISFIRLQESGDFIYEMLADDMPDFLISVFLMLVGIVLSVGSLAIRKKKDKRLELLSMGVFSLSTSIWTVTETLVLQMITGNPAAVHFIGYMSLLILPIPAVVFVASITNRLEQWPGHFIIAATVLNIVLSTISTLAGGYDYHQLLILSHGIIFLSLLVCIIYIGDSIIQKQLYNTANLMMAVSCFFMFAGGLADIIRYRYGHNSSDIAMFTRYGLVMFMLIMGGYEIYNIMQYARFEDEAAMMYRLAHTDSMTQMRNRTAYTERADMLKKMDTGSGHFVLLDINNLKTVNDVYGHEEGDKHIKKGAEIIRRSFGQYGECYRIGGDEFFVIVEEPASEDKCRSAERRLNELVEDYNKRDKHPVPLAIAYGSAPYDCAKGNVREANHEADERMYERKKAMKDKEGRGNG